MDVLSGGRLLFGVGVGYLGPEFEALGIPMENRARRTEEYIEAMRAIWSMDEPAYDGEFVSFSDVQARPRPTQQPGPPVVMGGHTAPAFRRSVTMSEGWYGFALDYDGTQRCLDGLMEAGARYERPAELGRLEISVTPRVRPTPEMVERFAEMEVDRLILLPNGQTVDEVAAFIDHIGETLLS